MHLIYITEHCILPTLQQFQCAEAVQGNAAKLHQSVGLAEMNRK